MLKNKIYIVACVFVILACAIFSSRTTPNIVFLDKNQLSSFLIKDPDNYYQSFTKQDMQVRKINSVSDYYSIIERSVGEFTPQQKESISKCAIMADNFFKNIRYDWFHGYKATKISWVFGCVNEKMYEEGLPHTRLNVIILPSALVSDIPNNSLVSLLIHEKVHVYQKCFPEDIEKYYVVNHMSLVGTRANNDNIRANPDATSSIYASNNTVYALEYNPQPKSIGDTREGGEDHPNEKMAYEIAGLYSNPHI